MEKIVHLKSKNVLGEALAPCSPSPTTGFYRDGFCRVGDDDTGNHSVCAIMTQEFLDFSMKHGNDLSTPRPENGFPGLKPGDRWCLCAARWQEAFQENVAPPVVLEATSEAALKEIRLGDLRSHVIN
jgi:uncharacterized protein